MFCSVVGFSGLGPVFAQQQSSSSPSSSQQQITNSPCSEAQCKNGGICILGGSVLASEEVTVGDFHCACQPGWTGPTCSDPFDSCSVDMPCKNNGNCLLGLRDNYGNEQYFCDCNHALDSDGNKVVGKWCEHQAVTYCDGQGGFCVNGECNANYQTSTDSPMCLCVDGHGGPHCEFSKGQAPRCDLGCEHGGHCVLGETTNAPDIYHYWDTSENQQDMMHCKCKDGYDGPLCEQRKSACGDGHCFNGSKCVEKIGTDGKSHFHCDCTAANTEDMAFAGRFCQYSATTYCTAQDDTGGALFCVNNGRCKNDVYEGCDCDEPYTGFSCEFQSPSTQVTSAESPAETPNSSQSDPNTGSTQQANVHDSVMDDPNYVSCDTSCLNDGICRKGAKDLGTLGQIAHDIEHLNQTSNVEFEHCVCRPGFAGVHCETKVDVCGQGQHVCLHGSKCVTNGKYHACDCSNANQGDASEEFAGRSCEHKATDICTKGELGPGKPLSFCTNAGTCKKQVSSNEPHPGCDCSSDWTGAHCELRLSPDPLPQSSPTSNANDEGSPGQGGGLVFEIIFLILSLVAFAVMILIGFSMYLQNKKQAAAHSASFSNDREPYKDEANISPRRDSVPDPFPSRFHSSSSDPFVSVIFEESEPTRKASRAPHALEPVEIC